jgi:hypothetical protein
MISAQAPTTVDTWLQWFDTYKQASCWAFLCTRYHLDVLDADALMNTARFQVFLHWTTVKNPLAYFWHTLTHAVSKPRQRHIYERRQLVAYAHQHQIHVRHAARTAQQVADLLERVSPHQRCLLAGWVQGYDDTQVAIRLRTTPQAIRVARHRAYRALQSQFDPSDRQLSEEFKRHAPRGNDFLGASNILPRSKPIGEHQARLSATTSSAFGPRGTQLITEAPDGAHCAVGSWGVGCLAL